MAITDPDVRPLDRPLVILYGDSLAWEAQAAFAGALAGRPVEVELRTFGGTAICDWLDEMAADAQVLRPGLVVVEFSGNNFTPCMQGPDGTPLTGAALVDRYTTDAAVVISTFTAVGSQVVFAGAPDALDPAAAPGRLDDTYERLADAHADVRFADAGSAVLAAGTWAAALPCLPDEPCVGTPDDPGVKVVRAPDGIHFCPASAGATAGVTGDCPVWSSGAHRYGKALAAPVIEALDAAAG